MAINIFSTLMMSRRGIALPLLLTALPALVGAACNKVPLLAPSGSKIVVTTTATALPINGSADIIAQILEAAGTPPQDGTLVTFITTLGTVQPSEAETSGGRVRVKFIAGTTSGTATIIATSGGATPVTAGTTTGASTTSGSDTVKIAIGTAAVGFITIAATPTTLPANGGTSTITATVADAGGSTLSGIPVSFATDAGSVSPAAVTTDANGRAQTALTTARTAKVTATAGLPTGSGATATTPSNAVTVAVNTIQAIAIGTITPASPTVGQAVTVPLTYAATAGASPVTKVSVNWGDGTVETFTGQPGAVSHVYQADGSYVVKVTGTDSSGDTTSTSASITVGLGPRPTVGMTVNNDNPSLGTSGATVIFTVNASELNAGTSGAAIRNVQLDFDVDGSSLDDGTVDLGATGTTATHTYTTAGRKRAVATATDTNGKTATAQVTVNVK